VIIIIILIIREREGEREGEGGREGIDEMKLLVSKEEYQAVTLCINITHTPSK
jgi:hypothetical protein